jgi:transcriptional regulator with XRE-family HTH domain
MRLAHSWTQQQAADEWERRWPDRPKDKKWFSYQERWPNGGRAPSLSDLHRLAQLYQCAVADLLSDVSYSDLDPLAEARQLSDTDDGRDLVPTQVRSPQGELASVTSLGQAVIVGPDAGNDEDVDRREFTAGAVLAALALPAALRELLTADAPQRRLISTGEIDAIRAYVEDSRHSDAALGGGSQCDVAATLHSQVKTWLTSRSQPREIQQALEALVGDLGTWVGWLAYDAGRIASAKQYLQDTIVHARLVDYPAVEVRAMACMCLLLNRSGRPAEALQCAEAAQRIAQRWTWPRLASLLRLREAAAQAHLGDAGEFARALADAEAGLDRWGTDDEPAWTRFVTPAELTGLAGQSQLVLGQPEKAAAAFRSIVDDPDPTFHRNGVYYTVQLAHATAAQGDSRGAAHVALDALPLVTALHSGRTRRSLHRLRVRLDSSRSSPVVDEFADAYDLAMGA